MASAAPLTTALPDVESDPNALRIVLFGMPDAGKSSLIGALVQATSTQDRILQGRLIDMTNGMAELWRRVYEERQRETLEEIVPYPVYFEPYGGAVDGTPNLSVMLIDCDGRIANELLSQRRALQKSARSGKLANAILDADALILTIDASASNAQVATDFREFTPFLEALETHRGHDHAIGGLPVFLALTKCDRLIREPVPKAEWQRRIGIRHAQVKERFARYLEQNTGAAGTHVTFGSLDLHVFPTAVKQPALADAPAQPRSPYGVAELFHDCFRAAHHFRERSKRADRRLKWIAGAAAGFILAAFLIALILIGTGGPTEKPVGLADRVAQFEARDKPLPERLTGENVVRRTAELSALRDHPDFNKLPDDKRNIVRDRFDEVQAYQRLRDQLAILPGPEKARNLTELDQLQDKLETQAALPPAFLESWEKTPPPAVVERTRRLNDIQALRDGIDELRNFFSTLKNKANDRLFDAEFHPRWDEQVNVVFENGDNPPFNKTEGPHSVAYHFDEVAAIEKEWQSARKKLQDLRGLAGALGLTTDATGSAAVLVIPPTPVDANVNSVSTARIESLRKRYPDWKTWSLASIPEPLQNEVRKKLTRSYDQMIRDGQRMILDKLRQIRKSGTDTTDDWHDVADWLTSPGLQEWRELLGFIAKLLDPASADPVVALTTFLRKDQFDLQIRELTISIPKDLPQGMLQPAETMQIHLRPRGRATVRSTLTFRISRPATIDGKRESRYRYLLDEGDGRLVFKPGDDFSAELGLTKGTKNWELVWSNTPPGSFAIAVFTREPRLRTAGAIDKGSIAEGITVTVEGKFPAIPALLPDLRGDGR